MWKRAISGSGGGGEPLDYESYIGVVDNGGNITIPTTKKARGLTVYWGIGSALNNYWKWLEDGTCIAQNGQAQPSNNATYNNNSIVFPSIATGQQAGNGYYTIVY